MESYAVTKVITQVHLVEVHLTEVRVQGIGKHPEYEPVFKNMPQLRQNSIKKCV